MLHKGEQVALGVLEEAHRLLSDLPERSLGVATDEMGLVELDSLARPGEFGYEA